jgi:hypothetical protein
VGSRTNRFGWAVVWIASSGIRSVHNWLGGHSDLPELREQAEFVDRRVVGVHRGAAADEQVRVGAAGDRLEITGARRGLAGAEAVLRLRAVISNGDLDRYWAHHLDREHHRLHQSATKRPTPSALDHTSH